MAKKENNRVSVNTLEKYYKSVKTGKKVVTIGTGENAFDVEVTQKIGLVDYAAAIKLVVDSVFDDNLRYKAAMKELMVRHAVVSFYTNMAMPKDVALEYEFLVNTDIFDTIVAAIDPVQLGCLVADIDEQIDAMQENYNSERRKELDMAIAVMNQIVAKFNKITEISERLVGDDLKNLSDKLIEMSGNVKENVTEAAEMFTDHAVATGGEESGEGV